MKIYHRLLTPMQLQELEEKCPNNTFEVLFKDSECQNLKYTIRGQDYPITQYLVKITEGETE